MPTQSFLKTIRFDNKEHSRNFILALENAKGKKSKSIHLTRTHKDIKQDEIKDFFSK